MLQHLCHGDEAFGAVAVGHLGKEVGGNLKELCAFGFEPGKEGVFIFAEEEFGGEPCFGDGHAVFIGAGQFPVAFEDGEFFFFTVPSFPEPDEMFDAVILGTGNKSRVHKKQSFLFRDNISPERSFFQFF